MATGTQPPPAKPAVPGEVAKAGRVGQAGRWRHRRARTADPAVPLATRDPESAQIAGILPFFVLMFASNAVVPVATMPSWLQGFANNQPFSVTITAVRALLEGGPAAQSVWQSLAWSAGITAVFFAIALHLYRRSVQ